MGRAGCYLSRRGKGNFAISVFGFAIGAWRIVALTGWRNNFKLSLAFSAKKLVKRHIEPPLASDTKQVLNYYTPLIFAICGA